MLTGEAARNYTYSYLHTGNSTTKTNGDFLIGAALGKDGGPNSDGKYANELYDMCSATNPYYPGCQKPKDFGFWFGIGGAWSWPAARLLGSADPVSPRKAQGYVEFSGNVR